MPEIPLIVKGAGKATSDLKQVAGGFRAIGQEANNAAKSSERAISPSKGFRALGRATGTAAGSLLGGVARFAGMGGGVGIAGAGILLAAKGIEAINAASERKMEDAVEEVRVMRELGQITSQVTEKLHDLARAEYERMTPLDKAILRRKDPEAAKALDFADAADKRAKAIRQSHFASDLMLAKANDLAELSAPNLIKALPALESKRNAFDEAQAAVNAQGWLGKFLDNSGKGLSLGLHDTAVDKLTKAAEALEKASNTLIDGAVAADRAYNSRAARLPGP